MSWESWLVLVVLIAGIVYLIAIYNRLVGLRNRFKNSFSQIGSGCVIIPHLLCLALLFISWNVE